MLNSKNYSLISVVIISSTAGITLFESGVAHAAAPMSPASISDWVHVPGALIRPDCVHGIPNGAKIEDNNDITLNRTVVGHFDACPESFIPSRSVHGPSHGASSGSVPGTGGWVEGVEESPSLSSGQSISYLSASWTVPPPPTTIGATIFLWDGLEPSGGSDGCSGSSCGVMQPVLQWGVATGGIPVGGSGTVPEGSNQHWVITSWDCTFNGNCYYSPPVQVSQGDLIVGTVYISGQSGNTLDWAVGTFDETSGGYTTYATASTNVQWNWAYAPVLEEYGVTSCSQFPAATGYFAATAFSNILLFTGYPSSSIATGSWVGQLDGWGYWLEAEYNLKCFGQTAGSNNSQGGSNVVFY